MTKARRLPPVLMAAVGLSVVALGVIVAIIAISMSSSVSSLGTSPALRQSEDRTAPLTQQGAGGVEIPDFYSIKAAGFDKSAEVFSSAVSLMPFRVNPPGYVPQGLKLWHVDAHSTGVEALGHFELYYTLPSTSDVQPAIRISWSKGADPADVEPRLHAFVEKGTFEASGYAWSYFFEHWPGFDMYEARTISSDGILIAADIRIVGLTKLAALDELERFLASLGPQSP